MMSIIIGLVTVAAGIAGMVMKWFGGEVTGLEMFLRALVAVVPALLIVSGLIAVIAGISGMKDKAAEEKEKKPEPEQPKPEAGEKKK